MNIAEYIDCFDRQGKEQNIIYRRAAASFGLSDTALWVLYILSVATAPVTQQDMCRTLFFPKQTVNNAISGLKKDGYLVLEAVPGQKRQKRVVLTPAGEALAQKTACRLREAELRAFSAFSKEELEGWLALETRLTALLREEAEGLCKPRSDGAGKLPAGKSMNQQEKHL